MHCSSPVQVLDGQKVAPARMFVTWPSPLSLTRPAVAPPRARTENAADKASSLVGLDFSRERATTRMTTATTTVDRISGKYRRSNANFIERRRVHQLNERFDTLRQMLPPTGEKQSKVVVLTRSADLIRCQQQVIRDLMAQLDQLQHSLAAAASGFKPFDYAASCPPSIDGPDRGSRPPPVGGGYYGLPSVAISDFSADGKRGRSVPISAPGVAGFKPESDVERLSDGHSSAPTSPKKTVSLSAVTPEKNDSTAVSALMQLSASPPAVSDREFERYSVMRKVRNSPVVAPYRRNLAHDFRAIAPNPPSVVAAAGAAASATPIAAMSRNYLGWLQGTARFHRSKFS